MAHNPQVFSTSFFLCNNNKGFSLHKIKQNGISSTFKFKCKINNSKNMKEKASFSFIQDEVPADKIHNNKKQSEENRKMKMKSLNLELLQHLNRQKHNKSSEHRYGKNKINSFILQPKFPEIKHKKMSNILKQQKNSDITQQQILQTKQQHQKQEIYNKTIQAFRLGQNVHKIQALIKKQVLKTQNQAVLRQNQIKLDETKINYLVKASRKKASTISKKQRKRIEKLEQLHASEKRRRSIQNVIEMQGPKITKFDTSNIRLIETLYPRQKKTNSKAQISFKFSKNNKNTPQKQHHNPVLGWQNQNLSQSSQLFDKQYELFEQNNNKKILFLQSERLN